MPHSGGKEEGCGGRGERETHTHSRKKQHELRGIGMQYVRAR